MALYIPPSPALLTLWGKAPKSTSISHQARVYEVKIAGYLSVLVNIFISAGLFFMASSNACFTSILPGL